MEIPKPIEHLLTGSMKYLGTKQKSEHEGYENTELYAVRVGGKIQWLFFDPFNKDWNYEDIELKFKPNVLKTEKHWKTVAKRKKGLVVPLEPIRRKPKAHRKKTAPRAHELKQQSKTSKAVERLVAKKPPKKARSPSPEKSEPEPSVIGGLLGSIGTLFGSSTPAPKPKPTIPPSLPAALGPAWAPDLSASIAAKPSPAKKPPKKVAFTEPHVAPVFEADIGEDSLKALQQISQAAMEKHVAAKKRGGKRPAYGTTSVWRRPPRRTPAYTTQRPFQMNLKQKSFRQLLGWMPKYQALYS